MFEKIDDKIWLVGCVTHLTLDEARELRDSLNEAISELARAEQNAHLTGGGLCAKCGSPSWAHGAIGHDFISPHPQVA